VWDTRFPEESQGHSLRHFPLRIEAFFLIGWGRVWDTLFPEEFETHSLRHSSSPRDRNCLTETPQRNLYLWDSEKSIGLLLKLRLLGLFCLPKRPVIVAKEIYNKVALFPIKISQFEEHINNLGDSWESQRHSDSQAHSSLKSNAGCETPSSSHTLFLRDTLTLRHTLPWRVRQSVRHILLWGVSDTLSEALFLKDWGTRS